MGAPPEVLARAQADTARRQAFNVLPCNLEAVEVFWALSTQWRTAVGLSGAVRLGLDYGAIRPVLACMRIPRGRWAGLFDSLRVMEFAALKVKL